MERIELIELLSNVINPQGNGLYNINPLEYWTRKSYTEFVNSVLCNNNTEYHYENEDYTELNSEIIEQLYD